MTVRDRSETVPEPGTRPLRVMVAPTGARRTRADHPRLPVTADEIARTAHACQAAGAQAIHLHVRDSDGRHSLDPARYREAIAAIEEAAPGMDVQITTEAVGRHAVADQRRTIEAVRPREASVAVREAARDEAEAARLFAAAAEMGTRIQHILFTPDDFARLRDWQRRGIVPAGALDVLFVLGRYDPPTDARTGDLAPFLERLGPDIASWMVCAFGRNEHAVALAAARLGGDVRIGFENNIFRPDGTLARDNAENVARFVEAARRLPRPLAA